ncbi:MAG TPA: NAD-dependent epimerase/dehydratase family protein, partial [Gemmata sp.]|nr:NAD-dependent epimerase/dehydratase family protein [Gemmata sp.]
MSRSTRRARLILHPSSFINSRVKLKMRILITGITGFVGGHLVEALVAGGHALFGLSRRGAWPKALFHLSDKAELLPGDIGDTARVETVLGHARPDWVMHLAGYANPGRSSQEPDRCWHEN